VAPESGRVVKKIYQLTAEGWPSLRIARKLSAENAPTWHPQAKQTMYAKHFTAPAVCQPFNPSLQITQLI
jgi:DNA-binding PadR family transcriptional regulator